MSAYDYQTGEYLGHATERLEAESEAAGPTGAVLGYQLEDGDWDFCSPDAGAALRRRGYEIRTVYCD